jgi:chromosome partitioning protein
MILGIVQEKGGVGKTTTTINLGGWLANLGARVLLVDLDPQGNLARGLGVAGTPGAMYKVFRDPSFDIVHAIQSSGYDRLDVVAAETALEAAEIELISVLSRESILRRKLASPDIMSRYDHVLLDCRPSVGILTVNAMVASDALLVPVETQYFALESVQTLMTVVQTVKETLNPSLRIAGIVPTKHEPRVRVCQVTLQLLHERYPDLLTRTVIRKHVAYPEAQMRGAPIHVAAPGTEADDAYRALALELLGDKVPGSLTSVSPQKRRRRAEHASHVEQPGLPLD